MIRFDRMGFLTSGSPNHRSDCAAELLRELRKRARDPDGQSAAEALSDTEASFLEIYGEKLTEASASRRNEEDNLGDLLSDLAPDGTVFEIREDERGHFNYGYFFGDAHD